jgi:hypothetical protein
VIDLKQAPKLDESLPEKWQWNSEDWNISGTASGFDVKLEGQIKAFVVEPAGTELTWATLIPELQECAAGSPHADVKAFIGEFVAFLQS